MLIKQRTVFVLGAGANKPLGFPLARDLKNLVQVTLVDPSRLRVLAEALRISPSLLAPTAEKLSTALADSRLSSVDEFLETNKSGPSYLPIAKAAIAQVLLPRETPANLRNQPDWCGDLYQRLADAASGAAYLHEHKISFVTFNYDRSLEEFLYGGLSNSLGVGGSEVAARLAEIPIIHMYGSLGPLPWQAADHAIRYGVGRPTADVIRQAASSLQLIGDSDRSGQFEEAKELVQRDGDTYSITTNILRGLNLSGFGQGLIPVSNTTGEGMINLQSALSRTINLGEEVED